jgi:uncharacterized protein DUF1876
MIGIGAMVHRSDQLQEVPMTDQSWQVDIAFTEEDDRTRADAILELASQRFHGFGQAKRAPKDPRVPVIGQDLAAARALSDLSHQLLHAAAERIEAFEGHPVDLRG